MHSFSRRKGCHANAGGLTVRSLPYRSPYLAKQAAGGLAPVLELRPLHDVAGFHSMSMNLTMRWHKTLGRSHATRSPIPSGRTGAPAWCACVQFGPQARCMHPQDC